MTTLGVQQTINRDAIKNGNKMIIQRRIQEEAINRLEQKVNSNKPGLFVRCLKIFKWPFSILSGVTGAGLTGGALLIMDQGLVFSGALTGPIIGAVIGLGVTLYLSNKGISWLINNWQERDVRSIKEKSDKLNEDFLRYFFELEHGTKVNIVFNREIVATQGENAGIGLFKMTKERCDEMAQLFIADKNKPILEVIDLSYAGMDDKQFMQLLSAGMGSFNTTKLILRHNQLTEKSLEYLCKKIKKGEMFTKLKILDVAGNKFGEESLELIYQIAEHLGLEVLDLSDNDLVVKKSVDRQLSRVDEFLRLKVHHLYHLKKLMLRNIGLSFYCKETIKAFLLGLNNIESLDLRGNINLDFWYLNDKVFKKVIKNNLSLTELITDSKALPFLEAIRAKENALSEMGYQSSESRMIFLLRQILKGNPSSLAERYIVLQKAADRIKKENIDVTKTNELNNVLKTELKAHYALASNDGLISEVPPVIPQFLERNQPKLILLKTKVLLQSQDLKLLAFEEGIIGVNFATKKMVIKTIKRIVDKMVKQNLTHYYLPLVINNERIILSFDEAKESIIFIKEKMTDDKVREVLNVDNLPDLSLRFNENMPNSSWDEVMELQENGTENRTKLVI